MLVEGRLIAGPTPQIKPGREGETKNEVKTSLTPNAGLPPSTRAGWLTNGTITLAMRFQSLFNANGITGCTFRMNRVASLGPTFCSQLNCRIPSPSGTAIALHDRGSHD